jgi:hypothetical protein
MTLTIDITPELERKLTERAQQAGQSLPEFAKALLIQATRSGEGSLSVHEQGVIAARLAALARIGSYDTRVRAGLEPLSDEAVRRESIY